MDKYPNYPDHLAARIASTPGLPHAAVINEGVNGDISLQGIHMLQEDVLDQPGVTDAIVEVDTNDITIGMTAQQIEPPIRCTSARST